MSNPGPVINKTVTSGPNRPIHRYAPKKPREYHSIPGRLFVGNLPVDTTETELYTRFNRIPGVQVTSIDIIKDKTTDIFKQYAYLNIQIPVNDTDTTNDNINNKNNNNNGKATTLDHTTIPSSSPDISSASSSSTVTVDPIDKVIKLYNNLVYRGTRLRVQKAHENYQQTLVREKEAFTAEQEQQRQTKEKEIAEKQRQLDETVQKHQQMYMDGTLELKIRKRKGSALVKTNPLPIETTIDAESREAERLMNLPESKRLKQKQNLRHRSLHLSLVKKNEGEGEGKDEGEDKEKRNSPYPTINWNEPKTTSVTQKHMKSFLQQKRLKETYASDDSDRSSTSSSSSSSSSSSGSSIPMKHPSSSSVTASLSFSSQKPITHLVCGEDQTGTVNHGKSIPSSSSLSTVISKIISVPPSTSKSTSVKHDTASSSSDSDTFSTDSDDSDDTDMGTTKRYHTSTVTGNPSIASLSSNTVVVPPSISSSTSSTSSSSSSSATTATTTLSSEEDSLLQQMKEEKAKHLALLSSMFGENAEEEETKVTKSNKKDNVTPNGEKPSTVEKPIKSKDKTSPPPSVTVPAASVTTTTDTIPLSVTTNGVLSTTANTKPHVKVNQSWRELIYGNSLAEAGRNQVDINLELPEVKTAAAMAARVIPTDNTKSSDIIVIKSVTNSKATATGTTTNGKVALAPYKGFVKSFTNTEFKLSSLFSLDTNDEEMDNDDGKEKDEQHNEDNEDEEHTHPSLSASTKVADEPAQNESPTENSGKNTKPKKQHEGTVTFESTKKSKVGNNTSSNKETSQPSLNTNKPKPSKAVSNTAPISTPVAPVTTAANLLAAASFFMRGAPTTVPVTVPTTNTNNTVGNTYGQDTYHNRQGYSNNNTNHYQHQQYSSSPSNYRNNQNNNNQNNNYNNNSIHQPYTNSYGAPQQQQSSSSYNNRQNQYNRQNNNKYYNGDTEYNNNNNNYRYNQQQQQPRYNHKGNQQYNQPYNQQSYTSSVLPPPPPPEPDVFMGGRGISNRPAWMDTVETTVQSSSPSAPHYPSSAKPSPPQAIAPMNHRQLAPVVKESLKSDFRLKMKHAKR